MTYQIILIILVIIILVLVLTRRGRQALRQAQGKFVGICAVAIGQDAKKRENQEKILALLSQKSEVSNADIREALRISDRSVIRYMDELEKEGKVEQIGTTGRGVVYRLK